MQRESRPTGCKACVYYDTCPDKPMKTKDCEYFDPDDDDYMDKWVKRSTDEEREEYREAFLEYAGQYAEDAEG